MPLVNMKDLLSDAQKGNYAVGSFSVANMEMVLGIIKAAEETGLADNPAWAINQKIFFFLRVYNTVKPIIQCSLFST